MNTQEIGEIIKMHRKAAGLSRIRLAELAGVGKTVIFDLENGKETVQLDTMFKLFAALGIEMELKSRYLSNRACHETR